MPVWLAFLVYVCSDIMHTKASASKVSSAVQLWRLMRFATILAAVNKVARKMKTALAVLAVVRLPSLRSSRFIGAIEGTRKCNVISNEALYAHYIVAEVIDVV
jgi:hypothetical protein